jgi:hypothetical protein
LGQKAEYSIEDALRLSDTDIGTCYDGEYQYVQTKAASVAAPALGLVAFWTDQENYIVTPDAPASSGCIAGVYLSAPTKGYFCVIQRGGRMNLKFKTPTTKATPAACDLIICDPGSNLADALVDGNNLTVLQAKNILGVAATAATPGAFGVVQGWERFRKS